MKPKRKYNKNFRRPKKGEVVEWDISQEQVDSMVEEFLVKKRAEEAKNPPKKVEAQPSNKFEKELKYYKGWFGRSGRGRPRKNLTKMVAMIKKENGLLQRANRGRPATNEVRIKVEVPCNLIVHRPPILYKFSEEGTLVKATPKATL